MKKMLFVLLAALMILGLTACGAQETADGSIRVVTTVFPGYDWVKEIVGENNPDVDITFLLDNGVDLHSYQPTAGDILKISSCDVFIYVGGESDGWVEDALAEAANPDMQVISLLDALGDSVKEEEIVEGMQADDDHEEEEEAEYDEHVWLSLRNAEVLVSSIAEALGRADAANAESYASNAKAYREKLDALDQEYREVVSASDQKTILFGDRFPFRYLVDDYDLNYYAAFAGCSAESEASFETIIFLAGKVDELGLNTILTIDGGDQTIAETIAENTASGDLEILVLNSMQGTTLAEARNGATYLSIMADNLEVLRKALR